MEQQYRIFVGGIPVRVDKRTLLEFFSQFGQIRNCKFKKNSRTGRSLGYAYLTFENADVFETLAERQVEFCGRICECKGIMRRKGLETENLPDDTNNISLANALICSQEPENIIKLNLESSVDD